MNKTGKLLLLLIMIALIGIAHSLPEFKTFNSSYFTANCGTTRVICKLDREGYPVCFVQVPCIKTEGWDTMAQIKFWRRIMRLAPDSGLVNAASSRTIMGTIRMDDYLQLNTDKRDSFKQNWAEKHGLPAHDRVYITSGKNWFYNPKNIAPKIKRAIELFDSMGVDPFFAQAVLLIESPVGNLKSESGAYGQFQLMKSVARQFGLKVDARIDEHEDFEKSAVAASRLFNEICIPYAAKMLEEAGYPYHRQSLWFRLLVMHVYHAGAANVKNALKMMPNVASGIDFIRSLWTIESGSFRNAAQNYSQLVLASYLEFNHYMMNYGMDYRFVSNDK